MAVVKGDDKIEKILPLVGATIPLAMAAYGGYKGYKDARVDDPTLGLVSGELGGGWDVGGEDPTQGQRITAGLANALGYGAGGGVARVGTRLGLRSAGRAAATRARYGQTGQALRSDAVTHPRAFTAFRDRPTGIGMDDYAAQTAMYRTPTYAQPRLPGSAAARGAGRLGRPLTPAEVKQLNAMEATAAGRFTNNPLGRLVGADDAAMAARAAKTGGGTMGRLAQAGVVGAGIYGGLSSLGQGISNLVTGGGQQNVNIPNQGASGSALGQGGMGNMAGARHGINPERQIWSGALEQSRIATGENMTLGDRLLKEAQERMDKAHCGTMKAEDCPGCPDCEGDNKKKAKKPAHGMVIVIGSKAGPGPSKDGKREKLDSDKDDKKE